jgi:hypothetical protein
MGISYLTRNIADLGDRVLRCNTKQNPLAYFDGKDFKAVDISSVSETFNNKSKKIYLRDKGIVSVGILKEDSAEKFIGFRPDENQEGSEQLEFSLKNIEINGKKKTIDLSKKSSVDANTFSLGDFFIQSTRQRSRLMYKVDKATDSFKIHLGLNLTGLEIKHGKDVDEYRIYGEKRKFRFKLDKPRLIGLDGHPLLFENSNPELVKHSLIDNGDGTFDYIKEPGADFGKVILPESYFIDASVCYSSVADGEVYQGGTDWSAARSAASGFDLDSSSVFRSAAMVAEKSGSNYIIHRSFFYFDTSAIEGSISQVIEKLFRYGSITGNVIAILGMQSDPLILDDFDQFGSDIFGEQEWSGGYDYKSINFDSEGIDAIQKGGTTLICNKEYDHDFLDSPPGDGLSFGGGCYFSDYSGTTYDPYLQISLSGSPWYFYFN